MSQKLKESFQIVDIFAFFKSRLFRYTLLRLLLFILVLWLVISLALKIYTNHGQKLKLSNYTNLPVKKVEQLVYAHGFELVITDSVHMPGRPGGMVTSQVPPANSYVKRGRKIYVTVSRFNADIIESDVLFSSYGKKFEHKRTELFNLFGLKSKLRSAEYDPGPPGHILKIYYRDQLIVDKNIQTSGIKISKGDTLEMIVSSLTGGSLEIPDLRCKDYSEALFLLDAAGLKLGEISMNGEIANTDSSFVVDQYPAFKSGALIQMGEKIDLTISATKGDDCD
ncbi:MAG: PASTA domain-containing protein [Saprospiraceae bacterium]|nr:PASTA domain-containing protein [Saprospiraceae bacterium]MBK7810591.1 PASTA domain-containing protein [Saprospiraceae bacterium]MBK9630182.1 PASTA domain-containing protein [Saprospiraceae bacterium]